MQERDELPPANDAVGSALAGVAQPRRRLLAKALIATVIVIGLGLGVLFTYRDAPAAILTNQVTSVTRGDQRLITANGIPDHTPGRFPNRGNPHTIRAQNYQFRMPLKPEAAARVTPLRHLLFGVALNGVPFDPGTAEFWRNNPDSGWRYEALGGRLDLGCDRHNAHVQPSGAYHYHSLPTGLIEKRAKPGTMTLVGYAADGFPVYAKYGPIDPADLASKLVALRSSYRVREGMRDTGPGGKYDGTFTQDFEYVRGAGDLDECNGRAGATPEYPDGTYHYFLTEEFPFIPRYFRGTPDDSFRHRGPPPGRGFRPPGKKGFGPKLD